MDYRSKCEIINFQKKTEKYLHNLGSGEKITLNR